MLADKAEEDLIGDGNCTLPFAHGEQNLANVQFQCRLSLDRFRAILRANATSQHSRGFLIGELLQVLLLQQRLQICQCLVVLLQGLLVLVVPEVFVADLTDALLCEHQLGGLALHREVQWMCREGIAICRLGHGNLLLRDLTAALDDHINHGSASPVRLDVSFCIGRGLAVCGKALDEAQHLHSTNYSSNDLVEAIQVVGFV
mmetsp:Transcript_118081/g.280336  ORF Transcript_118081/g.280336 Transcript_118081/m.280336 type:complete len:202 (-) Transcript_118081:645-1250(-)